MDNNLVGWFEIYVADMARAKQFYETVFQVKLEKIPMPELDIWAFPMVKDRSGAAGALVHMPGVPVGGGSVLVYFSCDDCAVEAGRVNAAGGHVERDKMPIGEYGFIVIAKDSEGNMIGLHSMV